MREFLHQVQAVLVSYGPPGVVLISAFDSMGVPLPAVLDSMLIAIAAGSVHSPGVAYLSALLAVAGSTVGNIILFQAARHGRRLFRKTEPPAEKRRRLQHWFREYGLLTVFIPAVTPFVPLPLKVFVIWSGAMHTRPGKFVAVILAARIIRYFGIVYLGLQLGADAEGFLIRNGWTIAGAALAAALALYLVLRFAGRRRVSAM